VPSFLLSCLTYFSVALPGSTLGVLWPYIRLDLDQPVGALGFVLVTNVVATVLASVLTGHGVTRRPLALGTALTAAALALEAGTSSMWVFTVGSALFGLGFGALDAGLNAHAARHLGPRNITWLHAGYGLGAIAGPLLATAVLSSGLTWRVVFGVFAGTQAVVACVLAATRERHVARTTTGGGSTGQVGALVTVAVEAGIETCAGIWGYLFLTEGRGLGPAAAGLVVSAYWATMFVGRVLLGPVAERVGARVVLAWAIGGVAVGTAVLVVPGHVPAVAGLLIIGLAAAPVVPLFALTAGSARAVGWQAAASSAGGSVLSAGMGLLIGASGPSVLAPSLLVMGVMTFLMSLVPRGPRVWSLGMRTRRRPSA
jgi:MFS family permease